MANKLKLAVVPKILGLKTLKVKQTEPMRSSSQASSSRRIYKPKVRLTAHINKAK